MFTFYYRNVFIYKLKENFTNILLGYPVITSNEYIIYSNELGVQE